MNLFSKITLLCSPLALIGCSGSYQYDVYVENSTIVPIEVNFATSVDRNGTEKGQVVVAPGERLKIISTIDQIDAINDEPMSPDHCSTVADYINAAMVDTDMVAENVWCGDNVVLSKVDIQQGEFYVNFRPEDFE